MNAITDLAARATSFITAIQTTLMKASIEEDRAHEKMSILNLQPQNFRTVFKSFINLELEKYAENVSSGSYDCFAVRAVELVWISNDKADPGKAVDYAFRLSVALVDWISDNKSKGIENMYNVYGGFPTPFIWRETLVDVLYNNPEERIKLAVALQYLPIQVVLALGGGSNIPHTQRLLQMWQATDADWKNLLNVEERKFSTRIQDFEAKSKITAGKLLKVEVDLFDHLIKKHVPLSFEHVLRAELQEIIKNRNRRTLENVIADTDYPGEENYFASLAALAEKQNDPFAMSKELKLHALAFSGGGIRSATFNLGILEGLAQNNLLSKFDYLSTVSGGGYIGSWLAAWMKRDGSVVKVSDRICPDKSPDPVGEELKPIKWLRMFSNYFAPDASIMSADSWTVGITWLRNTLLNQLVILLMLLSVLFAGNFLFEFWSNSIKHELNFSVNEMILSSALLLLPLCVLAGLGMHAYHKERIKKIRLRRAHTRAVSMWIICIALSGAYLLSGWFSSPWHPIGEAIPRTIFSKIRVLFPAGVVSAIAMLIVSALGRYDNCIQDSVFPRLYIWLSARTNAWSEARLLARVWAWFMLTITALIASGIGVVFIALSSQLLLKLTEINTNFLRDHIRELQFIIGVPLILEVFSITVVSRMAFLGKYFPDERREWWGRMGALIHRISFLWILIAASALMGKEIVYHMYSKWPKAGALATGGWMGLVGFAVKVAFNSGSSEKSTKPSKLNWKNLLGIAAPYLFALGLLFFLPALIKPLINLQKEISPGPSEEFQNLMLCAITFLVAYFLADLLGVNEFSMHHFYRNRLVRAYLGATRRSTDRQKTANPFTGFDMLDDEKLYKFQHKHGYHGPYPVLNAALNASQELDLDRQDRKAESFIFSPLFSGFDFSMARSAADIKTKSYDYAYRQTEHYAFPGGPSLGTAMAISGAAINPNQGYHSSAASAFLLTVFNVQMGRWIGNPRKRTWKTPDPKFGLGYIFYNMIGKTSTRNDFIALSDGGHFDNMGLYEMVRRKCSFIVLCDAEQDDQFQSEGLANAIRKCRIDFGAEIDLKIDDILKRDADRCSDANYVLGVIRYAGDSVDSPGGKILYIKSSLPKEIPVDVKEYAAKNNSFPHQTTADQFFDEEQFESYRRLGLQIANEAFQDPLIIAAMNLKGKSRMP